MALDTQNYTETNILEYLSMYQPKSIPGAPKGLIDFRNLNKYEQARESEKFFKQGHIQEYLDDKWVIELHNRDSFIKIYGMLTEFPDKKYQISQKLSQFKRTIDSADNLFRALRLDFSQYPFNGDSVKEKTNYIEPKEDPQVDWED